MKVTKTDWSEEEQKELEVMIVDIVKQYGAENQLSLRDNTISVNKYISNSRSRDKILRLFKEKVAGTKYEKVGLAFFVGTAPQYRKYAALLPRIGTRW